MKSKSLLLISILALSPALVTISACAKPSVEAQNGPITNISAQDANALIDKDPNINIIDIRTPQEFDTDHVRSSQNIDFYSPDFAQRVAALPKDKPYIVYCHSGNRSGKSMDVFKSLGFSKIYNVVGGISAWESKGLPK